jgi:hypothetical protein
MRAVVPLLLVVLAGTLALPTRALAEQSLASGAGKVSASARIDFKIVIPFTMALRVGAKAAATDMGAPSRVLDGRAMTRAVATQGVQLQSNMRVVVLSQEHGATAHLTLAAP